MRPAIDINLDKIYIWRVGPLLLISVSQTMSCKFVPIVPEWEFSYAVKLFQET